MPDRRYLLSRQSQLPLLLGMLISGLLLVALAIFGGFGQQQVPTFLLWHMLTETLSIVIAGLIFAFGWSTFRLQQQRSTLLLACAFLGVAILDFSHMLSFVGMPRYITPNSVEKGIQFWLAARYLAAITLLLLVWLPWRQTEGPPAAAGTRYAVLASILLLCLGIHLLVFVWPQSLPRTFIPGIGLTPLKVAAEYGLILLHVLTILRLLPLLARREQFNTALLAGAMLLSILSELLFTRYASATDVYNLTGHILKIQAYLLLYRAIFVETVSAPYQALKEAHRRNQALLKSIPDLMFEVDAAGRHTSVHGHTAELQQALESRVLGQTLEQVVRPEGASRLRQAMQIAETEGSSPAVQIRVDTLDGPHDYDVVVSRVHADGEPPRYMLLARDITERLADQRNLRQLREAVEQSPTPIMITDLSGRIEYVNQAFSHFSGYSREEVLGHDPSLLKSGHTPPEVYQQMWQQLLRGEAWRGEFINRRKDGSEYHEQALISPITDEQGQITHYLSVKEDITQRKLDQQRITHLAHFDSLTGLPNRTLFRMQFEQALSLARRQAQPLALLFIDLDHFKNINDSLGHRVGDQLLHAVSERLLPDLRQGDSLSRQGGDEFMLLLPCSAADGAAHLAERMLELLQQPFTLEDHQLMISASIGIALYPADGDDFDQLAQHADAAMYRAKQAGRNRYCFFTTEMQAQSARLLQLENALRQDGMHQQLQLYYQPQLDTDSGQPCGVEVLLRWQHPQLGWVAPAEFIPVAESSGLILGIGYWVLEQACQQMQQWRQQGLLAGCTISVNLSLLQLRDPRLVERVAGVLQRSGLPPCCLELELTESAAMHNPQAAIASVQALHQLGVQLAIDDFGTGYSSLAHLRQFQVHTLKIDQSFVRSLCIEGDDQSIIAAIISMASRLGIGVIAEGVETPAQRLQLRQLGCPQQQGYLFSHPLPAAELELWLHSHSQPVDAPVHHGEYI